MDTLSARLVVPPMCLARRVRGARASRYLVPAARRRGRAGVGRRPLLAREMLRRPGQSARRLYRI